MGRQRTYGNGPETPTRSYQWQSRSLCYFGTFSVLSVLALTLMAAEQYYTEVYKMGHIQRQIDGHANHTTVNDKRSPRHETHLHGHGQKLDEGKGKKRVHGEQKTYLVMWFSLLGFIQHRPEAKGRDFSKCAFNNCHLTFNRSFHSISDAILFDGRLIKQLPFNKTRGQVWVFAAHESQWRVELTISTSKQLNRSKWNNMFNWTMTFDKDIADIWLPYGEIKKRSVQVKRDFQAIAKKKTKGAIIITSHCKTLSKRMEFINNLKNYTNVTVSGECGKKWSCGQKLIHDNCFDILNNTYAFYLSFENALCDQYHTEKLFENFNYDILLVTRGGGKGSSTTEFLPGSVISTDTFKSVKQLGDYLTNLTTSKEEYAKRLEEKSQYYAVDYTDVYQRALCDLCYRLNHQEKFYKVIPDATRLFSKERSCFQPK